MAQVRWKENKVVSIKLRNGVWVLAQMLKSPYVLFFECFSEDNDWPINTTGLEFLFCSATLKPCLQKSEVQVQKGVEPIKNPRINELWIQTDGEAVKKSIWEGTRDHLEFFVIQ